MSSTKLYDPVFDILKNSRNPTTCAADVSGVVEVELKRRGICISCGHKRTVQMTMMGVVKRKSNHECYKHDLCKSCYDDRRQRELFTTCRAGPAISPGGIYGFLVGTNSPSPSPSSSRSRRRRRRPYIRIPTQRMNGLPHIPNLDGDCTPCSIARF